jgi:hypothetical protein
MTTDLPPTESRETGVSVLGETIEVLRWNGSITWVGFDFLFVCARLLFPKKECNRRVSMSLEELAERADISSKAVRNAQGQVEFVLSSKKDVTREQVPNSVFIGKGGTTRYA